MMSGSPDAKGAAFGGGVDGDFFEAAEERGIQQDGGAHVLRKLVADEFAAEAGVVEVHLAGGLVPRDLRAVLGHEGHDLVEIGDGRDVFQVNRLVGEERGADDGQRGVFVTGRRDGAGERFAAVDDEIGHLRKSEKRKVKSESEELGERAMKHFFEQKAAKAAKKGGGVFGLF